MKKQLPKISNDEMTLQVNNTLQGLDIFREEMEIKEKKRLRILNEMLYILDNLEPIGKPFDIQKPYSSNEENTSGQENTTTV